MIIQIPSLPNADRLAGPQRPARSAEVYRLVPQYIVARRLHLEREALLIAASKTTLSELLLKARATIKMWGGTTDEIDRQIDEIRAVVELRLDDLAAMTGLKFKRDAGPRRRCQ